MILTGLVILVLFMGSLIFGTNTDKKSLNFNSVFTPSSNEPRGIRNNNPGNIRISSNKWKGKESPNTDGAFEQFKEYRYGTRALIKLLKNYIEIKGLITITSIIDRYAPSNENNTSAYINQVANDTGFGKLQFLNSDKETLYKLAKAICKHENGKECLTLKQFNNAFELV